MSLGLSPAHTYDSVLFQLLNMARRARPIRSFTQKASTDIKLEDLYVTPKQRNLGLGKALFGELGKIATAKGCGRIEWRVLKVSKAL